MRKTLRIAWHAYAQQAFQGQFLFLYFGFPIAMCLLLIFSLTLTFWFFFADTRPVGYVDLAGVLRDPGATWPATDQVQPFESESDALAALQRGDLQGYYLLPADYLTTGEIVEVSPRLLILNGRDQFEIFLKDRLVRHTAPALQERLQRGLLDRGNRFERQALTADDYQARYQVRAVVVWAMMLVLYLSGLLSSAYLVSALFKENANRLTEIILSSVSAEQLLIGKLLGMLALALTPVVVWGGLAMGVGLSVLPLVGLTLPIPWGLLGLCLALFIPTYLIQSSFTLLLGVIAGTTSQTMRLASALTVGLLPLWWVAAAGVAVLSPASPVTLFFSLFPITAAMTLPVRLLETVVPPWQVALSLTGLYLALGVCFVVCARLYRFICLLRGQSLDWRVLWATARGL